MAVKLSDVQVGSACTVIEIKGGLKVRRHLAKLGVLPGVKVTLERSAGFGGAFLLDVEGQKIGVRRDIAAKILVEASA